MTEWLFMALMTAGTFLVPAGGTGIKDLRRTVWPIAAGLISFFLVGEWLPAVGIFISTLIVARLPYGDRTPWWLRFFVFSGFGAVSWAVQFVWWMPLMTGIPLITLFWLSRKYNWITHKVWEGSLGFLSAVAIIFAVLIRKEKKL